MQSAEAVKPEITIALGIPHAGFDPDRLKSLARLLGELGAPGEADEFPEAAHVVAYHVVQELGPVPPHVWAEKLWTWGISEYTTAATHFLTLQDDVVVAPNFWSALHAMIAALPNEVIGLFTAHPLARELAAEPDEAYRWCTTTEGVQGVAYVLPRAVLAEFLEWKRTKLRPGPFPEGEDTLLGLFCMATGRRVWHPIPTIVDHDTKLASGYGNDRVAFRRAAVRWDQGPEFDHAWEIEDLEGPGFWQGLFRRVPFHTEDGALLGYRRARNMDPEAATKCVRHLGRRYEVTPELARTWIEGYGDAEFWRDRRDSGAREKRRMAYAQRARLLATSTGDTKARVLVCSPRRGGVHPEYCSSVWRTIQLLDVDVENGWELLDAWQWHEDIVRVRSRFLRAALETDCTHVHFRDTDVRASPAVLGAMLRSGHAIVGCPYPRREGIDFQRVANANDWRPPEARAYQYPLGLLGPELAIDAHDCFPVGWIPLGCSLLERSAIERMIAHYGAGPEEIELATATQVAGVERAELERRLLALAAELQAWRKGHARLRFEDNFEGKKWPTVALFQLLMRDGQLWGEDQSFCIRARDMGIPVHAYCGPGSPVDHCGEHIFRGHCEALGLKRMSDEEAAAHRAGAAADGQAPVWFERGYDDQADAHIEDEPVVP